MPAPRPQLESAPLLPFLLAGAAFGVADAARLGAGGSLSLVGVSLTLHLLLALLLALAAGGGDALARALAPGHPWRAAALRAGAALPFLAPGLARAFEGAFAATLPGARQGYLWAPIVAWLLLVPAVRLGTPLVARSPRALGGVAIALAWGADLANRAVKPDELADLHVLLLCGSVGLAGLGLAWLLPRRGWSRRAPLVAAAALAVIFAFAASARWGLSRPADRARLLRGASHTRRLVRVARTLLDRDGDGYAHAFGGSDCQEGAADVHPGAPDIAGDGVDQDCDGRDGPPPRVAPPAPDPVTLQAWAADPAVRACMARMAAMDVLLITVDTLRADALDDTSEHRHRYPNLFALLDASRRFSRAWSPAAGTDLSLAGLMTGRVDPFTRPPKTLAEIWRDRGHATYAVIPRETLRYVGKTLLTRGFDRYERLVNDPLQHDVGSFSTSARTAKLATAMLRAHLDAEPARPLLLWAHFFDVHEHHEIDGRDRALRAALSGDDPQDRAARYRASLALVDRAVGEVLAAVRAAGRWDRTLVVFASDHGEGLGEDPRLPHNHGLVLYEPLVRIPLAVRVPGLPARDVDVPASLLDLYATLATLAGAPLPPGTFGLGLAHHLCDAGPPLPPDPTDRPLPLHEQEQVGVVSWPWKLLMRPADNLVELYDLAHDPGEAQDLADARPEQVERLRALYRTFPPVHLDRTRKGRRARERLARPESAPP